MKSERLGQYVVAGAVLFGTMAVGGDVVAARGALEPATERSEDAKPPASALKGTLLVSVHVSDSDADVTRGWVEARAAVTLQSMERPLLEGETISIRVHGAAYEYGISVLLGREGQALAAARQPSMIKCECGSDEMLDRVAGAIEDGVRVLAEVEAEERVAEEKAEAEAEAEAARQEEEEEERTREAERLARQQAPYRPSLRGDAGIGIGAVGVVALVVGIPLSLRSTEVREQGERIEVRSTRPAGIALAVGGGVALAAGVTLVVLDVVAHRKRKLVFSPVVGRGVAGASVGMRF